MDALENAFINQDYYDRMTLTDINGTKEWCRRTVDVTPRTPTQLLEDCGKFKPLIPNETLLELYAKSLIPYVRILTHSNAIHVAIQRAKDAPFILEPMKPGTLGYGLTAFLHWFPDATSIRVEFEGKCITVSKSFEPHPDPLYNYSWLLPDGCRISETIYDAQGIHRVIEGTNNYAKLTIKEAFTKQYLWRIMDVREGMEFQSFFKDPTMMVSQAIDYQKLVREFEAWYRIVPPNFTITLRNDHGPQIAIIQHPHPKHVICRFDHSDFFEVAPLDNDTFIFGINTIMEKMRWCNRLVFRYYINKIASKLVLVKISPGISDSTYVPDVQTIQEIMEGVEMESFTLYLFKEPKLSTDIENADLVITSEK